MFRDAICLIPPFNETLREKICGNSVFPGDDYSLFQTLTVLFYKRWPQFKLANYNVSATQPDSLHYFKNPSDDCLTFVWYYDCNENTVSELGEYQDFPNLERFLKDKLNQNIYIRTNGPKCVGIFCENVTLPLFHAVQVFIPNFFSTFFDAMPRTDDETNLLMSIAKQTDVGYKREIQNALEKEDLRSFLMKEQLTGFEKSLREVKYKGALQNVEKCREKTEAAMRDYQIAYQQMEVANALATGYKYAMDEATGDNEFEEYLCGNKLLSDISINGTVIQFVIKTFVNPYLPDDWDALSKRGSIFHGYARANNILDEEDNLKLLLDAIFSRNHTLKLRICGIINLDYYGSSVSSIRGFDYTELNPALKNYVPNGHLDTHNCFGQNRTDILAQMADGDMIGAVECCINVVKRMNVSERASFEPFVNNLKRCKGKCIVTEDGREMTPVEAVEYLKERMNETTSDGSGEAEVA